MFAFWYYSTSWLTVVALTLYSLVTNEPRGTAGEGQTT